MKYEIWLEGLCTSGERSQAERVSRKNELTLWEGDTFQEACENAITALKWEKKRYYDKERNTYWACRFFDNEKDARKSFG